jgi:hypothetical protein
MQLRASSALGVSRLEGGDWVPQVRAEDALKMS